MTFAKVGSSSIAEHGLRLTVEFIPFAASIAVFKAKRFVCSTTLSVMLYNNSLKTSKDLLT